MKTVFIEVTNEFNWGKFLVGKFSDEEWNRTSSMDGTQNSHLLNAIGWTRDHIWVCDLQTGEGACFKHGGYPKADLDKHKIWVCPMFEPFLAWLYKQDISDIDLLPRRVDFTKEETKEHTAMYGYRRPGPDGG